MPGIKWWGTLLTALLCVTAAAKEEQMSLQVREGQLRATPSFLGKPTASVAYGARFTVQATDGVWSKVIAVDGGQTGWIHSSALTKKTVTLAAGTGDAAVAASSGELALAGKGFNSDVEAQFKSRNKNIDFTVVDRMEKLTASIEAVQAFLKAGLVIPRGGAQ